ncbi:MAG: YggS family pyridoxal phosphate-dependent enzyme [Gemmatimonadales bacterium]|nr:YggS family pyridoxal phosphate-dependent enzyme [Gemmatimonadales bacterium]NIN11338.1 YggS family pyridoxal phosphate-dependent enzyme [Gemmatimonadales bacterium]NIN49948.1 YggS family pyridoxal phosphate-dependent enzyme [Gemmatimonadales bacterium]NIP07412.1 YggS family pyridoxal phosphate-dependent enzyme [Gemmatimonadales bacterium]NIR00479.1 YggS family pyridoxal phosphate-dependent enzyme [Gemmatimonadales bacterium]
MNFDAVPGNLAQVREDIARIQAHEGLSGNITIVAVTKGHPPEAARAACRSGLPDLGENRVQEALAKMDELPDLPVHWHLVGHLQTNKAKFVPGRFTMVHSIDSVRVAEALNRAMKRRSEGAVLPVLLQVNVGGEAQKSGCDPAEVEELAGQVVTLPTLELRGLMTMAPFTDDENVQRRVFRGLRRLREQLQSTGLALPELSMGMSDDFRAAVAEGASILRLGTVLFGERPL